VLYGSVPDLAGVSKREQSFSPIYIGTINGGCWRRYCMAA
jgi:hypothetical protein